MFLPEYEGNPADWQAFLEFCTAWLSTSGQPVYKAQYDHNSDGKINLQDFACFASVWDIPSNTESHYYYLHDALGSVRGLIGGKYNREEDREFYNYDVYGKPSETSAVGNPFLFAGYRYDTETGLYYLRARHYDPTTGRFIQFDPIGYADSMSLYEYVGSDPTNYIDPWGLKKYDLSHEFNNSGEFWDSKLNPDPSKYFFKVREQIGNLIESTANNNCIPKQLLAGVIINELTDYSNFERNLESIVDSASSSYGPAQIKPTTAKHFKVFGDKFPYSQREFSPDVGYFDNYNETIKMLRKVEMNIKAAGKLVKIYLDDLCKKAKQKQLSDSFSKEIAGGCDIKQFCVATECNKQQNCKEIVNMDIPECLLRSVASMHNSGLGITSTAKFSKNDPGLAMSNWSSYTWRYIGIFSDRWQKGADGKWHKK